MHPQTLIFLFPILSFTGSSLAHVPMETILLWATADGEGAGGLNLSPSILSDYRLTLAAGSEEGDCLASACVDKLAWPLTSNTHSLNEAVQHLILYRWTQQHSWTVKWKVEFQFLSCCHCHQKQSCSSNPNPKILNSNTNRSKKALKETEPNTRQSRKTSKVETLTHPGISLLSVCAEEDGVWQNNIPEPSLTLSALWGMHWACCTSEARGISHGSDKTGSSQPLQHSL